MNGLKKNLVPLLGIALVVAILATGIFYGLFVAKVRDVQKENSGDPVVVASRRLERGANLQAADLKVVTWPSTAKPKGVFAQTKGVEGAVLLNDLEENEPVLENRVASRDGQAGAGLGVPVGMRAVSVRVPETEGVIDLLRPGHHVDVQVISLPGAPAELRTVLQDILVLRVEVAKEQRGSPVVTLLVRPEEADAVSLADATARVRLILRNPLDDQRRKLPRLTLPPLFQAGLPPAAKR